MSVEERLAQIESKLDSLAALLIQVLDEQDDEPAFDLEGNPLPPDRDAHQPL